MFRSTNTGTSWTPANSGLGGSNVYVFSAFGTNLFAGTHGSGIFRSTNNGTNWIAVDSGLTNTLIKSFAVSGASLFVGTGDGVYLSTNNGLSWTVVNSGLTNTNVLALAVSGTNLFAGISGSGVWRRPLSEMITSAEMLLTDLPDHFSLHQNFPNPFNPSTSIRYGLPHASFVTLTVHNALGQQVAQLVNEQRQAGYHDVVFRGNGLASGVYYYRLKAGLFMSVKKLLLLK